MTRALFILGYLMIAAGVTKGLSEPTSIVRYRPVLHIFFDNGLQIIDMKQTFRFEADCYRAGEREAKKYRVPAPVYCQPVHNIIDLGAHYT